MWKFAGSLALTILTFGLAEAVSVAQIPQPVTAPLLTNISEMATLASNLKVRAAVDLQLTGTVLLDGRRGTMVMFDGSDALFPIEGNANVELRRGDRIRLTGMSILDGTNLLFGTRSLIENDGAHSLIEKSAGAWLKAGPQSIRVRYFNQTGEQGLALLMEGPDLPRQKTPNDLLVHASTNKESGTVDWKSGIAFNYYEGSWPRIPDFSRFPVVTNGVMSNFEIPALARSNNFGLEFTGFLTIPRDGFYIFSLQSDDGSLLDIGAPRHSLAVIGKTSLPPLRRLAAGQLIGDKPEKFCAAMEGEVTYASFNGEGLRLELVSGRSRALAIVEEFSAIEPQSLIGARLRLAGMCQRVFTPEGYNVAGRISVPHWENIQWLAAPEQLWKSEPITVRQAFAAGKTNPAPALLHLRGRIERDSDSESWFVQDATGKMQLESAEAEWLKPVSAADVTGFSAPNGTNVLLTGVIARPIASSNQNALPTLTSVEQVKHMSRDEAKRGYPVKVRGVITFVWPDAGFFLQDATGSIDVRMAPTAAKVSPQIGDFWEVEGETFTEFAPNIRAEKATRIGPGTLPNVVHPNWGQLVDGSLDAQFVEVEGVLLSVQDHTISLLTRGGRIKVELPDITHDVLAKLDGALIRVSGSLIPGRDVTTQQVKLGEFSLRSASIAVDQPAPENPFAIPLRHATDLLLFDSHTSPIQRTHLQGILLQQRDGICFLMDGTSGVRAVLKTPMTMQPGDQLELVGFPDLNGPSPVLHDSVVKVTDKRDLPAATPLKPESLLSGKLDSTRVQISATLTTTRISDSDQILEMRSGPRLWLARLPLNAGALPELTPGSELRLTGVYAGQGGDRANGRDIDSFELLLGSAKDVTVLAKPSWWTVRHALTVAGTLLAVLLLAVIWIGALRRKVEERTAELKQEIEDHERTELRLEEKTRMLTREIDERVRMEAEVERGHKQLMVTSRLAGMAEVATSVLHNVGNAMTSVNVLGSSIVDHVKNSKVSSLTRLGELLVENENEMARFLTEDERGQKLPGYVQRLGSHLLTEQSLLLEKVKTLNQSIHHINEIVAMQQNYAKVSGVLETVPPDELIEDALRMHGESLKRHGIELIRDFEKLPSITTDRHKLLQILFNLLENAKYACLQENPPEKKVSVTLRQPAGGLVSFAVADNGIGIPPENLTRIFGQGFSTRKDGHGFGLHSSVLTAQDMGGTLKAQSNGIGQGAVFTLEIPTEPPPGNRNSKTDAQNLSRETLSSESQPAG